MAPELEFIRKLIKKKAETETETETAICFQTLHLSTDSKRTRQEYPGCVYGRPRRFRLPKMKKEDFPWDRIITDGGELVAESSDEPKAVGSSESEEKNHGEDDVEEIRDVVKEEIRDGEDVAVKEEISDEEDDVTEEEEADMNLYAPMTIPIWDVSGRWYMIRDSDLKKQTIIGSIKKKNKKKKKRSCSQREPPEKHCGVHKLFGYDRGIRCSDGPLPCGDIFDWVSKSTPPNVMGGGALLAVPGDSSPTVSFYMLGGFDRAADYGEKPPTTTSTDSNPSTRCLTEEVFFKKKDLVALGVKEYEKAEEEEGGGWVRGPSMIKARSNAHPVFYNNKIYVFGSSFRRAEYGPLGDYIDPNTALWSPWAEVLDLGEAEENRAWKGLANPPVNLGHHSTILAHSIISDGEFGEERFLLYSDDTGHILSFSPADESYKFIAQAAGKFNGGAAFLDGVLYLVPIFKANGLEYNTIYYYDLNRGSNNPEAECVRKVLVDFRVLRVGSVIHGGLIPVGRNVLYVATAEDMELHTKNRRYLHTVHILKFRIAKKTSNNSLEVKATLVSRGSYLIPDIFSFEGILAPLTVKLLKRGGKERGKVSEEGKKGKDTL